MKQDDCVSKKILKKVFFLFIFSYVFVFIFYTLLTYYIQIGAIKPYGQQGFSLFLPIIIGFSFLLYFDVLDSFWSLILRVLCHRTLVVVRGKSTAILYVFLLLAMVAPLYFAQVDIVSVLVAKRKTIFESTQIKLIRTLVSLLIFNIIVIWVFTSPYVNQKKLESILRRTKYLLK